MASILNTDYIREAREALKLSQVDAAVEAGMSRQRWNDIERGRQANIEMDTLAAIAKVLKCSPKDLLIK